MEPDTKTIYNKISEFELEVTKEVTNPEPITTKYDRSFIEQQIKNIQEQKDSFNAQRDAEIAECNEILSKMDEMNIVVKEEVEQKEEPLQEEIKTI